MWGVNVLEKTIYIRMRNRVLTKPREKIYLMDIAQIIAPESTIPELKKIIVHQVTPDDKNIIIIDVMKIIKSMTDMFEEVEVQSIGPAQTIIEVINKNKANVHTLFSLNLVFIILWFCNGHYEFS